jgi:hypothetical protein
VSVSQSIIISHPFQRALNSRASPEKRQLEFLGGGQQKNGTAEQPQRQRGGGLSIGGLTLGGAGGGLNLGGLKLGGNGQQQAGQQNRNATQAAAEEKAPDAEAAKPAPKAAEPAVETVAPEAKEPTVSETPVESSAGAGTENQPGRAEGEAARKEALAESGQGEAAQQEKSNGVLATEESEKFSEELGITIDQAGNAQNLGGNLGITQGSDGSKSVGGENGINIAASGEATLAGNE